MIAQVYSVPGQTEEGRKAFLEWTSIDLSYKGTSKKNFCHALWISAVKKVRVCVCECVCVCVCVCVGGEG